MLLNLKNKTAKQISLPAPLPKLDKECIINISQKEFDKIENTLTDLMNNGIIYYSIGSGTLVSPDQSINNSIAIFDGTSGKKIKCSMAYIDNTGNFINYDGKINGVRHYASSEIDPQTPKAKDGDRYYNTKLHMEMRFDKSMDKWLSVESMTIQFTDGIKFVPPFNGLIMNLCVSDSSKVQFLDIKKEFDKADIAQINKNIKVGDIITFNISNEASGWVRIKWQI